MDFASLAIGGIILGCIGIAPALVSAVSNYGRGRKKFFVPALFITMSVVGVGAATRAEAAMNALGISTDEARGTALVSAVAVLSLGLGFALFGRRRFAQLFRDIVALVRLSFEKRRNLQPRLRSSCTRKYLFVVDQLAFTSVVRPDSRQRTRLSAVLFLRDFTDEELGIIAEYVNALFFAGHADSRRIIEFLEGERDTARDRPELVDGHIDRLRRFANDRGLAYVVSDVSPEDFRRDVTS